MENDFITLGIETSCDETAVAVIRGRYNAASSVVASQHDIHGRYGGIVPELACRRHVEIIAPAVDDALAKADIIMDNINLVSVTRGPGLVGALLVGLSYAKALAWAKAIPLVGVNHLGGHVMAAFVTKPDIPLPSISLLVSGGHTELFLVTAPGEFERLGGTRDDAAGEAFDKVAKLLGLGYPGGPQIEKIAEGQEACYPLPVAMSSSKNLDFSFSGPKTAVKRLFNDLKATGDFSTGEIAASFQKSIIDALELKTRLAIERYSPKSVSVVGGVACNGPLRKRIEKLGAAMGVCVVIPEPALCSDNAVMIAAAGASLYLDNPDDPAWRSFNNLDADPSWMP